MMISNQNWTKMAEGKTLLTPKQSLNVFPSITLVMVEASHDNRLASMQKYILAKTTCSHQRCLIVLNCLRLGIIGPESLECVKIIQAIFLSPSCSC